MSRSGMSSGVCVCVVFCVFSFQFMYNKNIKARNFLGIRGSYNCKGPGEFRFLLGPLTADTP